MKKILFIMVVTSFMAVGAFSQTVKVKPAIWTVDYIKAREGQLTDLLEFFRLNWTAARVQAKKAKYIEDYKMYVLPEAADYQVVLMTKYKNKAVYDQREANFAKIFAKFKPKTLLVNGKSSRDMRDIVKSEEFYETER